MNAKTTLRSLFSAILCFIFINIIKAQLHRAADGEKAVCTIKAGNKIYTVKPNQLGNFDEVAGMYPGEILPVEVYYPDGATGEKVIVGVEDGGSLDGGKAIRVIALDNKKKITFNFTVFDVGSHRISLRKEKDVKTIQIWGDSQLTSASAFSKNSTLAPSSPSGNTEKSGAGSQQPNNGKTGDPFVANTGNEIRNIPDLEIWGSIGQIPFTWVRYGNSRHGPFRNLLGDGANWNHSFKYEMSDAGITSDELPKIFIHYPEGNEQTFIKSATITNLWSTLHGVGQRLFQNNDTFTLATEDGCRYRFEKLTDQSSKTYYQLQSILDKYQNKFKLYYNEFHLLDSITEPAGRYFKIDYTEVNGKDEINKVSTHDGRSVKYHYSTYNDSLTKWVLLDSVYYGDGTVARYAYSQREPGEPPSLEHAIDPRYTMQYVNMRYTYDTTTNFFGFISQEKNGVTGDIMATLTRGINNRSVCYPNGKTETFDVPADQRGNVAGHIDGLGRITKNTYAGGDGFIETMADGLGRTTTYNKRTVYGNPIEITYPDGSKEKWTRDNLDLVLTQTDELERITKYTRDTKHRVIRISYPDGTYETFTYNDYGEVLDHRRQNGGIEHYFYDTEGQKISFSDALGNVTVYTYDNADRLAAITDAKGHTTAYTYNERGLLIMVTNPGGSKKNFLYDEFGNRTKITDELGHSWSTLYDEFKRPVTVTDPLNRITKYQYHLPGDVCGCTHSSNKPTKITLPSGKVTEIEYDVEWQKIKETVGAGTSDAATTFYEYDLVGNLVNTIDPKEKEWKTEYDKRDRKAASTDPLGNRSEYEYDLAGNIVKVTRSDSGMTVNHYDNMNRDTMTIDPKGQVTAMASDAEGNMIRLTDPKKQVYSFEYDLLNRKKKMIYPDGLYESYTYDSVGSLKTYTTRSGHIRTYIYDKRNRETNSSWKSPYINDTTPSITRTYDPVNRLLTLKSSVSSLTYKYNNANELISETQSVSGAGVPKTIGYGSNKDGLRKFMIYPDGSQVNYNYTGRNQVASISNGGTFPLVIYTYDLTGNRLSKTANNGTDVAYAYDDAERLLELLNRKATRPFASFNYGYDNLNRRTFVKRSNAIGDVNGDGYSYDSTDQLIKVLYEIFSSHGTSRTVTYIYDSSGNRTSVTDNGKVTNYTPNNLNQYTNINDSALSWTKDGNLKKLNEWAFTYDAQNRLTKAQKSDSTMSFAYDPMNRCVQRKLSKGLLNLSNTFLYYDDWNLIEERNAGDLQIAKYIQGATTDEILTKTSNKNSIWYHYDALGNVVRLTDSAGKMIERYIYDDVFGKTSIRDSSGKIIPESAYGNRFMFTGREYLKEIKLYDYRNRMYSDSLGRFLQIDPLEFNGGDNNLYGFVHNNPVNSFDPTGLNPHDKKQGWHKNSDGSWTRTYQTPGGGWVTETEWSDGARSFEQWYGEGGKYGSHSTYSSGDGSHYYGSYQGSDGSFSGYERNGSSQTYYGNHGESSQLGTKFSNGEGVFKGSGPPHDPSNYYAGVAATASGIFTVAAVAAGTGVVLGLTAPVWGAAAGVAGIVSGILWATSAW